MNCNFVGIGANVQMPKSLLRTYSVNVYTKMERINRIGSENEGEREKKQESHHLCVPLSKVGIEEAKHKFSGIMKMTTKKREL